MESQAARCFRHAQSLFAESRLNEAKINIEKACTLAPNTLEYMELHGRICLAMKDYAAAEPYLREYIRKMPTNVKALHRLSQVLTALGSYDEAITILQQLTALVPQNCQVKSQLGIAYADSGRLDEAIQYFRLLTEKSPGIAQFWFHYAEVLFTAKDYQTSIDAVKKCISLSPNSGKVAFLLSRIYYELHGLDASFLNDDQFVPLMDIALSEKLCKQLIKNNMLHWLPLFCRPELMHNYASPTLELACRTLIHANETETAKTWLTAYLQSDTFASRVIASQGYAFLEQDENEKAMLCFEGCLTIEPQNEYIVRALCECFLRLGNPQKALELLDMHDASTNPFLKYVRAKALAACDKYEESICVMKGLLSVDANNKARNHSYLAYLCLHLGNYQEAIENANKSLLLDNRRPYWALNTLGHAFAEMEDYPKAEAYFRRALLSTPEKTAPSINLAQCLLAEGKIWRAYELLIKLDQKNCRVQAAIRDVLIETINGNHTALVEKIIQDMHRIYTESKDMQRIDRIFSGSFDRKSGLLHIRKHYHDDLLKPLHGVFTISENELENVLNNLSLYPYEKQYNTKKYRIHYPNAGYDGGNQGDRHTLDYITVLVFLSEDYIITAYPSD